MTNIFGTPEKLKMRKRLFDIAVTALRREGWTVDKVVGAGKSSLRRIGKAGKELVVTIRTSQNTWIAFPRDPGDSNWVTLSEVDAVVAVSVDDKTDPKFAQVHLIDGAEMRERFDRAYEARRAAGHSLPVGRGVWVALYIPDSPSPVVHVGAGAGLDHPPIARVPLKSDPLAAGRAQANDHVQSEGLTIPEAKRRLALALGVDPSSITITVNA